MDKSIFIQTTYKDPNIKSYGCNFLTLCKIAQGKNPIIKLKTREDVLDFAKRCQLIAWQNETLLGEDFYVNSATRLLKELTGRDWKQLTVIDPKAGVAGGREWIPIHYPVPSGAIQIACYRRRDNFKLTHFSEIKTKEGETFSSTNVFNTLGEDWLEHNKGLWYASDKRVYVPVKAS